VRILGIDLAAQPRNTGLVLLAPTAPGRWRADVPPDAATDEHLVELGTRVDLIGVDAPLGWPIAFVQAVGAHQDRLPWPGTKDRRSLTHRHTDDVVRDRGWGRPMSASADKLGSVAMRCALLQRDWARRWGEAAPRDGSGRLVEVYPAAALRAWDLHESGYKGNSAEAGRVRTKIFSGITAAVDSWLDVSMIRSECINSDHTLDALLSALNAVAAGIGSTHRPESVEDHHCAVLEGWIHVPTTPLRWVVPPTPTSAPPPDETPFVA
jgi:predicted nuclease with RNAse H fold